MRNLIFSLSLFSLGIASLKTTFGSFVSDQACDGNYSDSSISNNNTPVKPLRVGEEFELSPKDFSIEDPLQKNSIRRQSKILTFNVNNSNSINPSKERRDPRNCTSSRFDEVKTLLPPPLPLPNLYSNERNKNKSPKYYIPFMDEKNKENIPPKRKLNQLGFSSMPHQFLEKENCTGEINLNKKKKKPYQCDQCPKSFKQKSNLTNHYRIHTGENPYQCDQCPKNFKQKSNLTRHYGIHTGEKPFKCKICNNFFTRSSNLKQHEGSYHGGEKPFKCEKCSKRFRLKEYLTRHIRRDCCKE